MGARSLVVRECGSLLVYFLLIRVIVYVQGVTRRNSKQRKVSNPVNLVGRQAPRAVRQRVRACRRDAEPRVVQQRVHVWVPVV